MKNLIYKTYTWPQNPERCQQVYAREPVYVKNEAGETVFDGMSPMRRTITGSGVFCGTEAYTAFQGLAALFQERSCGNLTHPLFGVVNCYFTELRLSQEPKPDWIAYQFTFREADTDGTLLD